MVQYALIVAGGKGLRMGTELPKQFLTLHFCMSTYFIPPTIIIYGEKQEGSKQK